MTATVSPRLAALARPKSVKGTALPSSACELCGAPLPDEHRHIADVESRSLLCACRACVVLLSRPGAGGDRFRLVPERRLALRGMDLTDAQWDALQLPVGLAFFFRSSAAGRVVALYPSPLGATESQLALDAWAEVESAHPAVAELEPDVEALLVDGTRGAREFFVVPVSDCYELVASIRSRWKGLAGGAEARDEIARFFGALRRRAQEA